MKNLKDLDLGSMLKLDFSKEQEHSPWLTSAYSLRVLIGILGMALPLLLYVFLYIATGHAKPLHSISHYYFTRVAGIFIVILSLLAIFLIIYKGRKPVDFIISTAAGVFALCVVFFPTGNITDICFDPGKIYSVTILNECNPRETFHYVSAAIFLLCLAYMSFFLFTKSSLKPDKRGSRKIIRNRIYRTCGVFIVLPILVILLGSFNIIIQEEWMENYQLTFWMETVAVESFGIAWLIKGEALFKDKEEEKTKA